MKVVFFGTGEFAVPALRSLAPYISLVVSQPDRPSGRGLQSRASAVKREAQRLGLRVETPERCGSPEFVEAVAQEGADVAVVAAYGQILPQALLDASRRGAVNFHASVLPKYRGAAPIQRAILAGETSTGVTLIQMDRGMDTGDVIAVETTEIGPYETYSELQERLAEIAARMASDWLPRIVAGDYPRVPQDHGNATYAPKVERGEAELRFDRDAVEEFRRYRAFTRTPGAFIETRFGRLGLHRVMPSMLCGEPGTVLSVRPALAVGFRGGALELDEVQPEGKKRMSGGDLVNGWRLVPGMSLRP